MRGRRKKKEIPFRRVLGRLMAANELSVREAAEIARVSPSTLHNWIVGGNPDDIRAVVRLARHFGCSLEYLLTGETERDARVPPATNFGPVDDFRAVRWGLFQLEHERDPILLAYTGSQRLQRIQWATDQMVDALRRNTPQGLSPDFLNVVHSGLRVSTGELLDPGRRFEAACRIAHAYIHARFFLTLASGVAPVMARPLQSQSQRDPDPRA